MDKVCGRRQKLRMHRGCHVWRRPPVDTFEERDRSNQLYERHLWIRPSRSEKQVMLLPEDRKLNEHHLSAHRVPYHVMSVGHASIFSMPVPTVSDGLGQAESVPAPHQGSHPLDCTCVPGHAHAQPQKTVQEATVLADQQRVCRVSAICIWRELGPSHTLAWTLTGRPFCESSAGASPHCCLRPVLTPVGHTEPTCTDMYVCTGQPCICSTWQMAHGHPFFILT
mmetsp:Transcript_39171/g.70249  ORF Transcript_39171/g.70249 Transcript_39171/m.70249 type:complete len:224 (-) Transcript_39171:157-828(-)